MKNSILLKLGLLIFAYTVIVSFHLSNSKYYLIKTDNDWLTQKDATIGKVPIDKYLEQEHYYELVNGHIYSKDIVLNTTKYTLPFQNINRNILTFFLVLSCTLIILAIDLTNVFFRKLVIVIIPLLLWFAMDGQKTKAVLSNYSLVQFSLQRLSSDIKDLKNDAESQEYRISDLEDN